MQAIDDADYFTNGPPPLLSLQTFAPIDPHVFLLTTEDGTKMLIDDTLGVQSIQDRAGNLVSIDDSGVYSSTGKAVTFQRATSGGASRASPTRTGTR